MRRLIDGRTVRSVIAGLILWQLINGALLLLVKVAQEWEDREWRRERDQRLEMEP